MRGCLTLVIGAVVLIGLLILFPLIREGTSLLNATTNITEYEGMAELADFAPLGILIVIGGLILLAVFRVKIFGRDIFGGGNE